MARVDWAQRARREFWDIVRYTALRSPQAALTVGENLESAADRLEDYPLLGRVVPEFSDAAVREPIVGNHRLVYIADDDVAFVVSVVHGSRDLLQILPDGPWDIE